MPVTEPTAQERRDQTDPLMMDSLLQGDQSPGGSLAGQSYAGRLDDTNGGSSITQGPADSTASDSKAGSLSDTPILLGDPMDDLGATPDYRRDRDEGRSA